MDLRWYRTLVLLVICPCVVLPQEATQNLKFYLDQPRHCNGPENNIFNKDATIYGHSPTEVQQSPTSCTIRLFTENNFEQAKFGIKVNAMSIRDCNVQVSIYDGFPGQPILDAYDCYKGKGLEYLITTSNRVSVVLSRKDNENTKYDIDLTITPLIAGNKPGYENNWGQDFGYHHNQVPNSVIYGCVGALFLLIVIVVIIVTVVCYRKKKGLNKPSEEYKISYINNNVNSMGRMSQGPVSESSTKKWVNASRENLRRDRKPRHPSDEDSVFDGSVDSIPEKKRYHPDRSFESHLHHSKDSRTPSRPSYRNDSYVGADDDHPQNTYIEREMRPRVKSAKRYEPEEDPELEDEEEIEEEEEPETEEEEEEEEEESEEEEEEEEEDDADAPQGPPQAPPHAVPEHPPPRIGHQSLSGLPQPVALQAQEQPHSYPGPMPVDPRQIPGGAYGPRFVVYPGQQQPGYVPYGPAPGQFQPVRAPPPYQANPNQQPAKPYEVKPSDPPIYSYLVQRGYNPVDGRESPVSVSTNASGHSGTHLIQPEDSDLSGHNLAAGVEYMRR